jgi:hypothetical protein
LEITWKVDLLANYPRVRLNYLPLLKVYSMRIINFTKHRIPRKWLQRILNHLGVNPQIEIHNSDNPDEVKNPNYVQEVGHTKTSLDGLADDDNRVYIFVGRWKAGKFDDYSARFVKWLLCHELRHQFYFYHLGNSKDPWKGLSQKERIRREERACNRFANLVMGVPDRDFKTLKNGKKRSDKSTKGV